MHSMDSKDVLLWPSCHFKCERKKHKFVHRRHFLFFSSKYLSVTPTPRSAICNSASCRNPGPRVLTTTSTSNILSLPSQCGTTMASSIPSSFIPILTLQPTTSKGDENGTVVWSGKLTVMGDLPCLVDLVSRSSNLKPAHL